LIGASISFIPMLKSVKLNKLGSVASILLGLVMLVIALNHSFIALIFLLAFAGAGLTLSNISVNSFLQENTTNAFRGRIVSLYQLALSGGISIGALLTGFDTAQFNISNAFLLNGIFALLFQSWLLWRQIKVPGKVKSPASL
jgi:MFS family permease